MTEGWTKIKITFTAKMRDSSDFRQITKQMSEMNIPSDIIAKYKADPNVRDIIPGIGRNEGTKTVNSFMSFFYSPGFDLNAFKADMQNLADKRDWALEII